MGLVQPIQGARSASEKLNYNAIVAGCEAVEKEAEKLGPIKDKLKESESSIAADVLSIDDQSVSKDLDEVCKKFDIKKAEILKKTNEIKAEAAKQYNEIQKILNQEVEPTNQTTMDENAIAEA